MPKKRNLRIEIVVSPLVDLEIMKLKTCREVQKVLKKYFTNVHITIIRRKEDLKKLAERKPDLVFSGIKYLGFSKKSLGRESKNKIWFADYLKTKGIPYTSSPASAIRAEFDKSLAKRVMQKHRVRTAPFFTALPGQYNKKAGLPLPYPLFIKPLYEGSGHGIGADSIVTDFDHFEKKVRMIVATFKTPTLVESYLKGREFTVGVLETARGHRIVMPVEQIAEADDKGNRILSFEAKKADRERLVSISSKKEHALLAALAEKAFVALGARGYGRIDLRMNGRGTPYFLEANLMPGLYPNKSYLFKTCKRNRKMSYETMILTIVESALARHQVAK